MTIINTTRKDGMLHLPLSPPALRAPAAVPHLTHAVAGWRLLAALPLALGVFIPAVTRAGAADVEKRSPRIVNIINFIRQCEPRIDWITQDVLYHTVVEQVNSMKTHHLKGTFLLQYDALIDERYQKLLKELPAEQFEIGAWWEIPQPLVEKSGYTWRGRFPWDWHADVGFATGYSPEERERLTDTYMAEFKRIFGSYPKSVGSWFIDEHTFNETSVTLDAAGGVKEGWHLELSSAGKAVLPFREITPKRLSCLFKEAPYFVSALQGTFTNAPGSSLRILPDHGKIVLDFARLPAAKDDGIDHMKQPQ